MDKQELVKFKEYLKENGFTEKENEYMVFELVRKEELGKNSFDEKIILKTVIFGIKTDGDCVVQASTSFFTLGKYIRSIIRVVKNIETIEEFKKFYNNGGSIMELATKFEFNL